MSHKPDKRIYEHQDDVKRVEEGLNWPLPPIPAKYSREKEVLDPDKPLYKASVRLAAKEKGARPQVNSGIALGMVAAGVSKKNVAEVLAVPVHTVDLALKRVENVQEVIQDFRERLKSLKIKRAHEIEAKLWDRAEKEVKKGEARDVDAVMRAILASEKVQVSVSGEAQQVNVSGALASAAPSVDLKLLIQNLLGPSTGPQ